MAKLRLSLEEQGLLKNIDQETLVFFSQLKDHKKFQGLIDLIFLLIDLEKNTFFSGNINDNDENLLKRYSFARGTVAGLLMLRNIILGANYELQKRDEARRKKVKDE